MKQRNVFRDQRGVGLVVVIIGAIVVLAGVGFVAYRTYKIQKDNSKSSTVVNSSKKNKTVTTPVPVTAKTKTINTTGYVLVTPDSWVSTDCGNGNPLLLAATQPYLGRCQSEASGQVSIYYGNQISLETEQQYKAECSCNNSMEFSNVTINGLKGVRVEYTTSEDDPIGGGKGSHRIKYVLNDNNKNLLAAYDEAPGWPNNRVAFEIVVKSIKVN